MAVKLSGLFSILDEHGVDRETFLNSLHMDEALFRNHEKKLTVSQVVRLLEKAALVTGNPDIGLLLGERAKYLPNIVCYIMMNCLTIGDALNKYSQYKRIFSDETNTRITRNRDTAFLTMNSTAPELAAFRPFTDYKLSTMFLFLRYLSGGKLELTGVSLNHDPPEDCSEYERVFPCPANFSQSFNSLNFKQEALNLPVTCPNRDLLDRFEEYARRILDKTSTPDSFSKRIGRMIIKALQSGDLPSIGQVADQFNMSVRKLQGLLGEENTTFTKLLNAVRERLAFAYLNDSNMTLSEVSYLLGFSEPSAFHRAFKKWTGSTPGRFRSTNDNYP